MAGKRWGKLTVLAMAAAAIVSTMGQAQAQQEEKVLNIYNWSDYIADDTIKNFEKETGIKAVSYTHLTLPTIYSV